MAKKNKRKNKGSGKALRAITLCISTAMVLILLGLTVFIGLTAHNLSEYVKENLTVTVIFDDNASNREAAAICRKMQAKHYVTSLQYISRDQALKEQTEALGTDPSEFLGSNPFSPSAELHLKADCANADSMKWITGDLKAYQQVSEVNYQKDLMDSVNENIRKVMLVMIVIAALLTFISFSLINNTVRLDVYARRFSINTMKLVGASWSFIRRPFLRMAILEGFIAGIAANAVLAGAFYAFYNFETDVMTIVTWQVLAITGATVLLAGILISFFCVFFSVNHFLSAPTKSLYRA